MNNAQLFAVLFIVQCLMTFAYIRFNEMTSDVGQCNCTSHAEQRRLHSTKANHVIPKVDVAYVRPQKMPDDTGYRIPNVVHQVFFGDPHQFTFLHALSLVSASTLQKPEVLYFHTDGEPTGNVWWEWAKRNASRVLKVNHVNRSMIVFGRRIRRVEHGSDIIRMQQLIEKGGIYLDFDVILLRSYDPLRHFRCVMDVGKRGYIANAILLAEKRSLFLRLWLDQYRTFDPNRWNDHSNREPWRLLQSFPELRQYAHVVNGTLLGTQFRRIRPQQLGHWDELTRGSYSLHVYNKRNFDKDKLPCTIPQNPQELKTLDNMVGEAMRYVYYGTREMLPT